MDKRSLFGVVLITLMVSGFFLWQTNIDNGNKKGKEQQTETVAIENDTENQVSDLIFKAVEASDLKEEEIIVNNGFVEYVFSNQGGSAKSIKLLKNEELDEDEEILFTGGTDYKAFNLYLSSQDKPLNDLLYYNLSEVNENGIQFLEFYRDYIGVNGEKFKLVKKFEFHKEEYLFNVTVQMENYDNSKVVSFNSKGNSYYFSFGPQLGPEFLKRSKYDFRKVALGYGTKVSGKKDNSYSSKKGEPADYVTLYSKYFAAIICSTLNTEQTKALVFEKPELNLPVRSEIFVKSESKEDYKVSDIYKVYVGPKTSKFLKKYNNASDNSFGYSELNLDKLASSGGIFRFLVSPLKIVLNWFYSWLKNYGLAIIFLTILIKILVFPITRKSYQSSADMQKLTPKINELKEKYKDNPQKMNMEMSKLYKEEGVNPMKGCLPMLIQMPIFIALYSLFSNYPALRGESFFWWMTDLSLPDAVVEFEPVNLLIITVQSLNILPILFVATQILSTKVMQGKNNTANGSMKFMTYGFPLIFFFVLYNAPSGLFVYWITSNIITLLQQLGYNRFKKYREKHPSKKQKKAKNDRFSKNGNKKIVNNKNVALKGNNKRKKR